MYSWIHAWYMLTFRTKFVPPIQRPKPWDLKYLRATKKLHDMRRSSDV